MQIKLRNTRTHLSDFRDFKFDVRGFIMDVTYWAENIECYLSYGYGGAWTQISHFNVFYVRTYHEESEKRNPELLFTHLETPKHHFVRKTKRF